VRFARIMAHLYELTQVEPAVLKAAIKMVASIRR
jgi:hypothetical protein